MPKVMHVKKAKKDNRKHGIKKGQEYWWVSTKRNGRFVKLYFKSKPRPSQLTGSDFLSTYYRIQESVSDEPRGSSADDFNTFLEEVKGELESLRDDTQSKYDNLPESFQNGSSGEQLQQRIDALDEIIDGLEEADEEGDDIDERYNQLAETLSSASFD